MEADVDVFLAVVCLLQTDHGWKNIHLGFYTETGGGDCSLKSAPDDGRNVARNMLSNICMTK
jgi:hypothetical protein